MNTEINLIAKSLARSRHSSVIGGKVNGVEDGIHLMNGFDNPVNVHNDFHVRNVNVMHSNEC